MAAARRLYGDAALAETDYPLVPADIVLEKAVRISVACDYGMSSASGEARRYRIVRSAYESTRDGEWDRSPRRVELFSLLPVGPVPKIRGSLISTHLPVGKRRVLFINDTRLRPAEL